MSAYHPSQPAALQFRSAMSIFLIRPATPADAEPIAQIFEESAEQHVMLDAEQYRIPPLPQIVERYREGRQHPEGSNAVTLVALLNRGIVGFVDVRMEVPFDPMRQEQQYCYVAEIAVTEEQRGRGVGQELLRAAEDWGKRQGAAFVFLDYNVANTRAGKLYEQRLGYRPASIVAVKRL